MLLAVLFACSSVAGESEIRAALQAGTGVVRLPAGPLDITSELAVPAGAHDLEIRGQGALLRVAPSFRGRAVFVVSGAVRVRFANFTIDGNRAALETRAGLPGYDVPFARFTVNNGILAEGVQGLTVAGVQFRNVAGFAVLASASAGVLLEDLRVEDCGSRNRHGRNNATGGVLLEEGAKDFRVLRSTFERVRGNAVWTHSLYTSPRNQDGRIEDNRFRDIGRDAIQVGHATRVRVEGNTGQRIGYPIEDVDVEGGGTPVAIDTAGNVDASLYAHNRFEEINGKCVDLDGFHDGEVRSNTCVNRRPAEEYPFGHFAVVMNNTNPDMESRNITVAGNEIDGAKFGGIFVIGTGHRIVGNRMRRLNLAGCNERSEKFGCRHFPGEPDLLQSGVYLGRRAERPAPARGNLVAENEISGWKMKTRCIGAAPGVRLEDNRLQGNTCRDGGGP